MRVGYRDDDGTGAKTTPPPSMRTRSVVFVFCFAPIALIAPIEYEMSRRWRGALVSTAARVFFVLVRNEMCVLCTNLHALAGTRLAAHARALAGM